MFLRIAVVVACMIIAEPAISQTYDLSVTANAVPFSGLSVGDHVDFTVDVHNGGPSPSSGSDSLVVTLPDAFIFSGTPSCSSYSEGSGSGTITFNWNSIGSLSPGQDATCTFGLTVNAFTSPSGSGVATLNPSTFQVNTGNDSSSVSFTFTATPPTFTSSLSANVLQQNITLDFGTANADSCVGSSTPSVSGWDGVTVCTSSAACASVSVPLTNVSAGSYTFSVTCVNANNDNVSSSTGAVVAANSSTDLSITTAPSSLNVALGQSFPIQFIAQNLGNQDAPGTSVDVTMPPQVQIVSTDCGIPADSGSATWNIGTLATGARALCNVQAKAVIATSSARVTLFITFAGADTNSSNDTASTPIAIGPGVDLGVTITSSDQFVTGQAASFTLTVTNVTGGGDATGVVVSEYPTSSGNVFADGGTNTCGVAPGSTFVWNVGNVAAGKSMSCTVSGTVTLASATTLTATVTSSSQDSNSSNDTATLAVQASAPPQLESSTITGTPTIGNSTHIILSASSKSLVSAFESTDPNLISGNINDGGQDIYTRPRGASSVLENVDATGHQLTGTSALPALSDDGSIVSFTHSAGKANLRKDISITGNIFAGSSQQPKHQVDTAMDGTAPNGTAVGGPSVSLAGGVSKLAFCSSASNLVPNDTNGANDVFLVDPLNPAQLTQLVSTDASGKQLSGDSCDPKLSADGTKLVFTTSSPASYGTGARQVVRKDLTSGALELISVSTSAAGKGANGDSTEPTISADGSVVAFSSKATDLDGLGNPVGGVEAYVSLAQSGAVGAPRLLKRLRGGDGVVPNGASQHPQVSHDATTVVMQTLATNIFGVGKGLTSQACGTIAITLPYFNPSILGSALCNGPSQNQNPSISGDGNTTGLDSDAPQPGTTSKNSNTYSQSGDTTDPGVVPVFSGDLNGQWFDPHQSGQGLVLDLLQPDANNQRHLLMDWFVFVDGHPTWVQGSGVPHAGSADQAGRIIVPMDQVAIFQGKSFPLGEAKASPVLWGSATLTFTDANTGILTWASAFPGFNSGSMAIRHFRAVNLPSDDAAGAKIKACYSGNWYEPAHLGHGFEFEVITSNGAPQLLVDWFAYDPSGSPVWLFGNGPINGNASSMTLGIIDGNGAQFPPKFDNTMTTPHPWGTVTFTFTDALHGHVVWNSTIPGYGSGQLDMVPSFGLDRRICP